MKLIPKKNKREAEKFAGPDGLARATDPIEASESKLLAAGKKEPAVRRVVRASARLADRITDEDRDTAMQVIRDAMKASSTIYDGNSKALLTLPDHKTRLAAATLQTAYDEGTPIKRQVTISGNFESADQLIERLKESPEALKSIMGAGVRLELGGQIIEGDFTVVEPDSSES